MICSRLPNRVSQMPNSTSVRLGHLQIALGNHGVMQPPGQGCELLIPTLQGLSVQHENLRCLLRPPLDLLYRSANSEGLQLSAFQGWRLLMDPEQLCLLAAELSDHRFSPGRFRRRLLTWVPLQPRTSPQKDLSEMLQQLLKLTQTTPLIQGKQLELVRLDQSITRLICLLLCGDLIETALLQGQPERGSRNMIIDDLLSWIDSNLHRQIQLRDLVERSGYSQRSLRNFFQERFGCGPINWIRNRRLSAAHARMLSPQPDDTVSSIAASYGYLNLSQFSRDFQNEYRHKPSELLREGRRTQSKANFS